MTILRTEMRRTIAPWMTLAVLVVGLGFFFSFMNKGPWFKDSAAWDAQWTSSVQWTRYLLMLLWPIIIGASAIQGMRDSRSGTLELLTTVPRPARHRMTKLSLALGSAAVLAYVVILLVGLAQVVAHDGLFTFSWVLPALVGLLTVVAGVGVGLGVGRMLPSPVTAPALAVLALVSCVLSQLSSEPSNVASGQLSNRLSQLSIAPPAPRSPFLVPTVTVSVGQLCWLAGLAATGFLLLAASTARRRLLALLPVVAGLAIALPLFPSSPAGNLAVDQAATAPVCEGPVCVTKMHADRLSAVAGPGQEALRLLAKIPGAPTGLRESTDVLRTTARLTGPQDPSKITVNFDDWSYRRKQGKDLVYQLVAGGGTEACGAPSYGGDRESREDAARWVVAGWVVGDLKPPPVSSYESWPDLANKVWATFRAVAPQDQVARVVASRQAELSCQGDALTALTQGAAG